MGGLAGEESMYISLNSVGTEFPKIYGNAGKNCETVFCFSLQGAERISSEAQIVSVERETVRPIYRAQGRKNKGFP